MALACFGEGICLLKLKDEKSCLQTTKLASLQTEKIKPEASL
jgi:hypothetical protein